MHIEQQHTQLVSNLIKDPEEILAGMTAHKAAVLHAMLGIAGEILELDAGIRANDLDNILEEAGDALFYLRDARSFFPPADVSSRPVTDISGVLAELLDGAKKYAIYNKSWLQVELGLSIATALADRWVVDSLRAFGFTRDEALGHNIAKLTKRYPQGTYTDTHAHARLDKEEEQ